MIVRISCLLVLVLFVSHQEGVYAVVNSKEFKRREASLNNGGSGNGISNSYGPPPTASSPLPIPVYGVPGPVAKYPPPPPDIPPPLPPSPSVPHREYGPPPSRPSVPTPSREYGVPFLQYGPPKVNIEYGVPLLKNIPLKNNFASVNSFQSAKSSFFDQIKSHFGVPKPVYGPPQYIQKPNMVAIQSVYGAPSPPLQTYGAPIKSAPSLSYGPPLKLSSVYGVPHSTHHTSSLSLVKPTAPVYGPPSLVIATTYVPPAPQPAPIYEPPPQIKQTYGLPVQPPSTSYGVPEISFSSHRTHNNIGSQSIKQIQILEGNDQHGGPTVSCDGWKPISGPVGDNIHSHGSVSNVGYSTGYSTVQNSASNDLTIHHSGGSNGKGLSGLTDEQLVAIALGGDNNNQQIAVDTVEDDFHSIQNNLNSNGIHSPSFEGLSDSYGAPPLDSYAPNSVHSQKYDTINLNQNDPVGLVPPSGKYGSPQPVNSYNHHPPPHPLNKIHDSGLGISYGSQSGNLKPWLYSGTPPKKPILYRPPVPQGLLESIGASVQHFDQYGVPPEKEPATYIPPPPSEIPQHEGSNEHHVASHSEHIQYAQPLPSLQEPRFNQAQDCGHGPSLSNSDFGNYELSSNRIPNYSSLEFQRQNLVDPSGPSDSYGPPPSGNVADAISYESKQNNVQISSQSTNSDTKSEENSSNLDSQNFITENNSHNTVTIPVQGQLGSYQLQFQSANSFDGNLNSPDQTTNHEQILSEGLLQTIISAIEQQPQTQVPQQDVHNNHQYVDSVNSRLDHKEATEFLQSPEGEKVLSEESNETQNQK